MRNRLVLKYYMLVKDFQLQDGSLARLRDTPAFGQQQQQKWTDSYILQRAYTSNSTELKFGIFSL